MYYRPQIASSQEFPQDSLVKHFDSEGRIVRIDFKSSGKYVLIEYLPEEEGRKNLRRVWWSDGHVFLSWDGGFEHTARPFTCDIPRISCCGECDRCSYRDDHRTFFKSYNIFY